MKSCTIALLLGCAGLVCTFAAQSNSIEPLALREFADLRSLLGRMRLAFPLGCPPELQLPPPISTVALRPGPPLLSKHETLALISGAARKYKVPAHFVASIVAAESNFDCAAISPKGAVGLMQLMPDTAQEFGADDPADPVQNIDAGTHYLRWLMDRYKTRQTSVIAAYNAGPGNVDHYHGVPPFRETRNYVTRVLKFVKEFAPRPIHVRSRALIAAQLPLFRR